MTWSEEDLNHRLRQFGLSGERWGARGFASVELIERELGLVLPSGLRQFIEQIGNLRVDPFNIVLAGDLQGRLNAVTETRRLRTAMLRDRPIKIMDHAGESYVYYAQDGRVTAYDSLSLADGQETRVWEDLEMFINWIFEEAKEIAKC